jgi:signal transduction histidine kinase
MAPASGNEIALNSLELWREVLDAMGRQDALGYLRRRCPTPQPAETLLRNLAGEQRQLTRDMDALSLAGEHGGAIAQDLAAFFLAVQVQICRWSREEGDQPVVWPWAEARGDAAPALLPQRSLAILHHASRAILSELDLRRLLPLLVDRAAALTQADVAFLALCDPVTGELEVVESRGLGSRLHRAHQPSEDEHRRLLGGEEARFVGLHRMPWLAELLGAHTLSGALVAPLRYQQAPLGVLVCAGGEVDLGAKESGEFLSLLANQTAIAIRNAAHYREVVHKAAALHTANDQLRSLDGMKDEFLATVSHELRTPLNFITGFGSILLDEQEGALTEEQRYFIKNMMDGAFQLLALVNDLLDYSRIRSGKLPMNLGPVDLNAMLQEAYALFHFQAVSLELTLTLDAPGNLPTVRGDRQRLSQVVNNLLTNALKFTPAQGHVRLSARLEADGVRVEVADSGVGIRADQMPLLFNRFSQLETGSTRQTGTGLGLAICKSLVEAHGGDIGVYSPAPLSPGQGSAFWFTLPLQP